jgi:hypothetical protein
MDYRRANFLRNLLMAKDLKSTNPDDYLAYLAGNASIAQIEQCFREFETRSRGANPIEVARQIARKYEDPSNLPASVWMDLQAELDSNQDDAEDFVPDFDSSDYSYISDSDSLDEMETFATSTYIDTIGSGLEIWPASKLHEARPIVAEAILHAEFPNGIHISPLNEFQARTSATKPHRVPVLGVQEIRNFMSKRSPDAIVMDPPLGDDGLSQTDLTEIFEIIRDRKPEGNTFVCDESLPELAHLFQNKSSTEIRKRLAENRSIDDLTYPSVVAYLKQMQWPPAADHHPPDPA